MKSTTSFRPRWSCRLLRSWSVVSGHLPTGHVESCPACHAYVREQYELEDALRRTSPAGRVAPSFGLELRIQRTVRNQLPPGATARPVFRPLPWAAAGLAAGLALGVIVWNRRAPVTLPAGPTAALSAAEAQAMVAAVESFSVQVTDTVIPTAGELVANNPLQQELDSLYTDARSALGFLALNFLPTAGGPPVAPRRG
jgi:hypothetical protein